MANVLEVIISGDSKKLDRALNIAEKRLQKVGQKMQTIGKNMSLYVTAPLSLAGGAMIKFASDYNESLNKVDVAFKNSSNSVKQFAKTSLEMFGIAEGTALDMAALFGDMATSMGINTNEASKLSTSLVGLAGDLASFKNMNIEEVTTALNGVFTGETESLKRLGVVMTEVNLEQFALSKNLQTSYKNMTQAEKVMLRYEYVMSKTSNAHGDFARTGGGAANQMRMFTEGLKQLGAEFGQVILPIFTKIVKVANSFIKGLAGLGDGTKTFIVALGGLAGAMGPIIYLIGSMKNNWVDGIKTMRSVYTNFISKISINPYLLLAGAIAGVALAIYQWNQAQDINNQLNENLNSINKTAIDNISGEIAEVNNLISLIKDENVSKEKKKDLVEQLNAISPEYLGAIDEEAIKTGEATEAIDKYKESLLEVAKQRAIMSKLQDLQTQYVSAEMKTNEEYAKNVAGTMILSTNKYGQQVIDTSLKEKLAKEEKKKALDVIQQQIDALTDLVDKDILVEEATKGVTKVMKEMTAEEKEFVYYTKEAAKALKEKFKAIEKEEEASQKLLETQFKKKKEDLYGDTKQMKGLAGASLGNQAKYYESFVDRIRSAKDKMGNPLDAFSRVDAMMKARQNIGLTTDELVNVMKSAQEEIAPIANSINQVFQQMAQGLVDSLNIQNTAFGNFVKGTIGFLTDLAGELIKNMIVKQYTSRKISEANQMEAMSGAGAGAVQTAQAAGPGFMFVLPALLAGAMALVSGAFKKVPKFANGGIVSGPTMAMVGEYTGAKRNPEVIAPLDKLQSIMGGSGNNVNVTGEFVVRGQDLVLALQRADQFKGRIS